MKKLFLTFISIISLATSFVIPQSVLAQGTPITSPLCKAVSAKFVPSGTKVNWYNDSTPPAVGIEIKTENCQGKHVEMSIVEEDPTGDDDLNNSGFDNAVFPIPATNVLMIYTKAGEEECEIGSAIDCHYYVQLYKSDGGITSDYSSLGKPEGELWYDCDVVCEDTWQDASLSSISGGQAAAKWFFFASLGTNPNKQGPFDTRTECDAKRATFPNAGNCFIEVTVTDPAGPTTQPVIITPGSGGAQYDNSGYDLLAPLPGITRVDNTLTFGDYLNIVLKLAIGIAGALAVLMLVIGGVQYMGSDAFSTKSDGKKRMANAIGGLLLALGSYMLLNTINPNLVNLKLSVEQVTATLTADDKNLDSTEVSSSSMAGYSMAGTFGIPQPSAGVNQFVTSYLRQGYTLSDIQINVVTKQATFTAKNGTLTQSVTVPVNIGQGGYSEVGQGREGDNKTPKGSTIITSDRRISSSQAKAVTDRIGVHNMGAAFINFGATVNGKDRGMGFHGKYNNTLGVTNGCIRMTNDDLVILAPYMKAGVRVVIQ